MKQFILILFYFTFTLATYAQDREQQYDKEKLDAARIAFITNRLDLKPPQAEKFWPIFNQYQEDRKALMEEMSTLNKSFMQETDNDRALEKIGKRFEIQQKLLDREKVFMNEIISAITPVQALKLNGVNREFTRQVYRMQQGRERGNRNN
ncbi:Spy/CpxP family protein refolding chaperone [Shivajiella indica]|uniref:Spy/CpxP family protein refolding chaperone n=1 Tax=Shivajiella indica TaxID=872115 RepID=A0ABW5B5L5_9BACT